MFNLDAKKVDARNPIASGSFGTILAYKDDKNIESKDWVVKCIPAKDTRELKFFMQEVVLGFNYRHPCIVSNRGYDLKDNPKGGWFIFVKMPRMDTSLKKLITEHIKTKTKPSLSDVIKYFYNIANGLEYLQKKRIIHNNINPGTILIDNENIARVGGIGLAQHKPWKEGKSGEGTSLYNAPERLEKNFVPEKDTAFKGDVWSLGVTIMEFCLLKLKRYYPEDDDDDDWMFESDSKDPKPQKEEKKMSDEEKKKVGSVLIEENLQDIKNLFGKKVGDLGVSESTEDSIKLLDILRKTLEVNPKKRLSFTEICKELNTAFPKSSLEDNLSSILNDQSRYEPDLDVNNNWLYYNSEFIDDEDESSQQLILSSFMDSNQTENSSNFSTANQHNLNTTSDM